LIATLTILPSQLAGQEHDPSKLVGTWKLTSGTYNGEAGDLGKQVMLKHLTGAHFTWLRYDAETKKLTQAAGGPYSVKGDVYAERPLYGIGDDFEIIRDKEHTFNWRVEGNKWYMNGQLANGVKIEEVWERVK
jgi:hypothetical protein